MKTRVPGYVLEGVCALLHPFYRGMTAERLAGLLAMMPKMGAVTCGEAAKELGVSTRTLQRRAAAAGLRPVRTVRKSGIPTNYYRLEDLAALMERGGDSEETSDSGKSEV